MNPDIRTGNIEGGAIITAEMAMHLTGGKHREQTLILTPHQTRKLFEQLRDGGADRVCTCLEHGKASA